MPENKPGVAFFEGNSWYHRIRTLQPDGTVKHSKKRGFKTADDAAKSYALYEETFKKSLRKYQAEQGKIVDFGLKDYLIYWFEELYSFRIENTTRMLGAYTLYKLILPCIVSDIKLKFVNADYLDALLETASKACPSAGNSCREFLGMALNEAVVSGYLKNNPILKTKRYPRRKPEIILLGKSRMKIFLKAASQSERYLEILLGLFCGLRKGEILGLKFTDFDYENNTVTIRRQITANPIVRKGDSKIEEYQRIEKEPKTENSYRTLRVPEEIMEELQKRKQFIGQWKEKGDFIDLDYISCQKNGLSHALSAMNIALTKICSRNGLPHITVHGLRHMYATILAEQGVSLPKISALLGHSSVTTTFEYYCDVMDENENIINYLNEQFTMEGDMGG